MSESQRRLAAIMFSDIVGYSKMMGDDERATLELLREHNAISLPIISAHGGTVLKFIGDAILSSYPSATSAVRCAMEIQKGLAARNAGKDRKVLVRIGVHIGDVVEQGGDIFGDGVNIAARIQPLAEPGGVCVSKTVYDMLRAQADVRMESVGVRSLKNIKERVEIFRVIEAGGAAKKKLPWKAAALAAAVVLCGLGGWTTRAKWAGVLGTRASSKKDRRFSVFVAPFHGGDADSVKDGQVMKQLVEERLTEQLGPLQDIRLIFDDSDPAPGSQDQAQALGAKLGASLVVWGEVVSLAGELNIKPFLTMIGTSFREEESSSLETGNSGGGQLERLKAKAAEVADLTVISAAWYYGVVDGERGLELLKTITPASAQSLVAEGYIRYGQKKWDAAAALFKKALTLDPKFTEAYNGLGNLARVRGKYDQAEAFYRKAIALRPEWPNSYYNLAQTYYVEGHSDKALFQYQRVIKLAPNDAVAHRSLANLYDQLGQYAKSADEYRIAIENCKPDPNSGFDDLYYYLALMRSGNEKKAAAFILDLVKKPGLKAPNLWPYYAAWLYAGKFSEDGVLKAADDVSADELGGRHCEAYYFLGMYHLLRARKEGAPELRKAGDYFQKCLQTNAYWYIEYHRAQAELGRLPKR